MWRSCAGLKPRVTQASETKLSLATNDLFRIILSATGLFCFFVVGGLVGSLADIYLRAAGFGVTGARSNQLGHVSHGMSLSGAILT